MRTIGIAPAPETIYYFGGSDDQLFSLTYPARTSTEVIAEIAQALETADIPQAQGPNCGYDHGAWIPLMLAFPHGTGRRVNLLRYDDSGLFQPCSEAQRRKVGTPSGRVYSIRVRQMQTQGDPYAPGDGDALCSGGFRTVARRPWRSGTCS